MLVALSMLGPVGRLSPPVRRAGLPTGQATVLPVAESVARADFGPERPSPDARQLADSVVASGDNQGLAFLVVDKPDARLFVFDPRGRLQGQAPILLGLAPGDDSVPGIGTRQMSRILPHERVTPAGRFIAEPGRNLEGEDIFWVDYDAAVSMHRVRAKVAAERRLERLASPTPTDNRISYGCINVPAGFYDSVVTKALADGRAVVYVLPEQRALVEVFDLPIVPLQPGMAWAGHP
jgi:hypothetical protein